MPAYVFLTKLWGDQVLYVMYSVGIESRMDGSKNGIPVYGSEPLIYDTIISVVVRDDQDN